MAGVVKAMDAAMKSMNLEKVSIFQLIFEFCESLLDVSFYLNVRFQR